MARPKDMHCYRNIFTIDTGYSFKNGAGYSIVDEETFKLKACGIVRPSVPGLEEFIALDEISNKFSKIWEQEVGFSYDPALLCIEFPRIYSFQTINQDSLLMLACLSGMIRNNHKVPLSRVLFPRPNEWKGQKKKNETKAEVIEYLDAWSKKILMKELDLIPQSLHHNVFDAIGMALWAIKKNKIYKKKPKYD